jgi:hypothetical protein
MKTFARIILSICILPLIFFADVAPAQAATNFTVSAPAEVLVNSQFTVTVKFRSVPLNGFHCVNIKLSPTQGFSIVGSSTKIQSHINYGQSPSISFTVKSVATPNIVGSMNVTATWSTQYSCGGTISSQTGSTPVKSLSPWTINVSVNPLCILEPGLVTYTLRNTDGTNPITTHSETAPYKVSFKVLGKAKSYTLYASWICVLTNGQDTLLRFPRNMTKTIYVTSNGQTFNYQP